jgi:hypothetical protein
MKASELPLAAVLRCCGLLFRAGVLRKSVLYRVREYGVDTGSVIGVVMISNSVAVIIQAMAVMGWVPPSGWVVMAVYG